MIILSSSYIYTNTILYTVEIYNPVSPPPPILLYTHDQKHDPLSKIPVQKNKQCEGQWHQANITSYELLNTHSTPHPRQKLNTPLIRPTDRHLYNPHSLSFFLKTILTQFSFIIVSLSRQQGPAKVRRGWEGGGSKGQLVCKGGGGFHGWAAALSA